MKMNFHRKTYRQKTWAPIVGGLIITLTLLFAVFRFFFPGATRDVGVFAVLPFWNTRSFGAKTFEVLTTYLADREYLLGRISELEEEVNFLQLTASSTVSDIFLSDDTIAPILSRPPLSRYDTFIVSVSSLPDKTSGMLAVYGGVALGKLVSVGDMSGLVELFSAPGVLTDAIVGTDRIPVVLVGRGGGGYEFEVPRESKISIGDEASLASHKTYLLGEVTSIEDTAENSFKKIFIQNNKNIFTIPSVLLLKQ